MYIINISLCLQWFIVGDKSYFSQDKEGRVPPQNFRLWEEYRKSSPVLPPKSYLDHSASKHGLIQANGSLYWVSIWEFNVGKPERDSETTSGNCKLIGNKVLYTVNISLH